MNDKWMKDLKDLAGGYQKKAPEGLLDDIKREMSRRGVVPASEPKKAPIVPMKWWRRSAAVVALAVASVVAIHEWDKKESTLTQEMSNIEVETNQVTQDNHVAQDIRDSQMAQIDTDSKIYNGSAKKAVQPRDICMTTSNPVIAEVQEADSSEVAKGNSTEDVNVVQQEDKNNDKQSPTATPSYATTHEHEYLAINTQPRHRSKTKRSSWGIGAYYGGGGNVSVNDNYSNMQMSDAGPSFATAAVYNWINTANTPEKYNNSENSSYLCDETHHRPLKFGISVRVNLNERWSLLSGFTYSYLNSEVNAELGNFNYLATQKLHYLGIPVAASYSIWRNKVVNVYAVAGGEVEKLVKGKQEFDIGSYGQPTMKKVQENRPVLSTNASAGIEGRIGKSMSLYAEPGVSYHFGNGSGIRSAYTERPWDFFINIGLRININEGLR
jgi:hypothetical protein